METTATEVTQQARLENAENFSDLIRELTKKQFMHFFGLSRQEIYDFINTVEFSRGGFSPMFLSPGYDGNDSDRPKILMTALSNRPDTYHHEARHGLHYKVCAAIFERPETYLKAFRSFCQNVLGDTRFIELLERDGSRRQKELTREARALEEKQEVSPTDISSLAVKLGALTYQHAYFVDPRMCEAVASFGDTGITRVVGAVNRAATFFIPYHDTLALKGYGDKKTQRMFETATLLQKSLLVKKEDYRRDIFFKPQ